MSAEVLREAARVLLERVSLLDDQSAWKAHGTRALGEPYRCHKSDCPVEHRDTVVYDDDENVVAYVATMHPGVGLALIRMLDHARARAESKIAHGGGESAVWATERDALAVARAILGGAS